MGIIKDSLMKSAEDIPEHLRRAQEMLEDFRIQFDTSDKMLLLHEVRRAAELQKRTLEVSLDGQISISREAAINYAGKWFGLTSNKEQSSIYFRRPNEQMLAKIRAVRRYEG